MPPDCGDVMRFGTWFVAAGDEVFEGERIAEVLIPGVAVDVIAPVAGRIVSRESKRGEPVGAGSILGWMETH